MKRILTIKNVNLFFIWFLIATIVGLMGTAINVSSELADNHFNLAIKDFDKIAYPLVDELTGVYSFFLLVPFILQFFIKFPLSKDNFISRFSLYILMTIAVGLTHTSLMYISRSIIYPVLNLGNYDYGNIPFSIVMEYLKQFISFWAVYAIFSIIKINKEREAQRLRNAKLEELLTKARLETLKTQLNPHFLFNTLNMISSTMYDNLETADTMIANLSDLLRITLKSSGKGENNLKSEIEILNLYIDIMKARFKEKLQVDLLIDNGVEKSLVPNFMLQPLVENSIKYGMENLSTTIIEISAKKENDKLLIKIKDNGPGITNDSRNVLNSGVGLSNTVERLEKLYGGNYEFNWENQAEGGLLLTIEIPYKEEGEEN